MDEKALEKTAEGAEFKVGNVLGDTFWILFRNVLPFGAMTAVLLGVLFGLMFFLPTLGGIMGVTDQMESAILFVGVFFIAIFFMGVFVLQAMISFGAYQDLRGRKAGFGVCVGRGFQFVLPVLGAAILVTLITWVFYLAFIIPGIIATIVLYVVVPVVVVERRGVLDSLKRSRELTKGNGGAIFGIIFVIGIVGGITGWISEAISPHMGQIAGSLLEGMVQGFNVLLFAIAPAVGYFHLRRAKEGVEIEQIAAVFD